MLGRKLQSRLEVNRESCIVRKPRQGPALTASTQIHPDHMKPGGQEFARHFQDVNGIRTSFKTVNEENRRCSLSIRPVKSVNMQKQFVVETGLNRENNGFVEQPDLPGRITADLTEQVRRDRLEMRISAEPRRDERDDRHGGSESRPNVRKERLANLFFPMKYAPRVLDPCPAVPVLILMEPNSVSSLLAESLAADPRPLVIAGRTFASRLFVGTGKFSSVDAMASCVRASGTEMVTVALRRVDLTQSVTHQDPVSHIDRSKIVLLPNTSGARDAREAVRLARLAREMGGGNWLKLEVTPDPVYLLPDPVETLKAAEELVKDGFIVLPYIHADPVLALKLQDVGCATVMPLGSPIGTNQGIRTAESIRIIIEQARVPVVVDAGLGAPSHAAEALEMGADAVLVNTAFAVAQDPERMGRAFALAVIAGRESFLYGVARAKDRGSWQNAKASSPLTGFLEP